MSRTITNKNHLGIKAYVVIPLLFASILSCKERNESSSLARESFKSTQARTSETQSGEFRHSNREEKKITNEMEQRFYEETGLTRKDLETIDFQQPKEIDFTRTKTEEEYFAQSGLQPNAPHWWHGMVGGAWRGQYGWRPKIEIRRVIEEIEVTSTKTPLQGNSLISEEEPIRTNIRMYRAFDKAFDDGHFDCPQSELSWLDEKEYYLVYQSSSKETEFKKGIAIRKDDGSIFKWELD